MKLTREQLLDLIKENNISVLQKKNEKFADIIAKYMYFYKVFEKSEPDSFEVKQLNNEYQKVNNLAPQFDPTKNYTDKELISIYKQQCTFFEKWSTEKEIESYEQKLAEHLHQFGIAGAPRAYNEICEYLDKLFKKL